MMSKRKRSPRATRAQGQRGKRCREDSVSRQKLAEMTARRASVADLYLQAWEQHRIAKELKVSPATIVRDLDAIHKLWEQSAVEAIAAYKMRELRRIDRIEREAWEQWERSKLDAVSVTTDAGVTTTGAIDKTSTKREGQCGDPRYLKIVTDCVGERAKILGLYAPVDQRQSGKITVSFVGDDHSDNDQEANPS